MEGFGACGPPQRNNSFVFNVMRLCEILPEVVSVFIFLNIMEGNHGELSSPSRVLISFNIPRGEKVLKHEADEGSLASDPDLLPRALRHHSRQIGLSNPQFSAKSVLL